MFAAEPGVAATATGKPPMVWLICVSVNETTNSICAEVSCPKAFDGSQFDGFSKRYFVMNEAMEPLPGKRRKGDDDDMDIDVVVTKK
jgi:hypothetical protein